MLILLPPSEGKTRPTHGDPVNLAGLSYAEELTTPRQEILNQLIQVATSDNPAAHLQVSPGLAEEVRAMAHIFSAPAAPALQVYTGVLYGALEHANWDETTWQRARTHLQIASTLWGMVRAGDHIPAYRLPPAATLPSGDKPVTLLRTAVTAAMEEVAASLVLDCRSGPYVPLWRPRNVPWYTVKIATLREGKKVSVSHQAKLTRGQLVNFLLQRPTALPRTHEELSSAVWEFHETAHQIPTVDVSVQAPQKAGKPGYVEIVVPPVTP